MTVATVFLVDVNVISLFAPSGCNAVVSWNVSPAAVRGFVGGVQRVPFGAAYKCTVIFAVLPLYVVRWSRFADSRGHYRRLQSTVATVSLRGGI